MNLIRTARAVALLTPLVIAAGLLAPPTASAATQLSATANVSIRSKATTASTKVGLLEQGQTITAVSTARGWTRVRFNGGRAYIAAKYLSTSKRIALDVQVSPGSVRSATTGLNVRSGAGSAAPKLGLLPDGTRVTMTGTTSRGFGKIVYRGGTAWASLTYLATVRGVLPAVVDTRTATAALDIRTSSGPSSRTIAEVRKGTRLAVTGVVRSSRAQVIYQGRARWVTAKYLVASGTAPAPSPGPPGLPAVTGLRYATTALDVRSTYADSYQLITEVPTGTELSITGVVRNGRMQIIWAKTPRWVTAKYLSTTAPSASPSPKYAVEKGLKPNAIKAHRAIRARHPQITTVYGVRPDSIPDHPTGRALDFMIPNYTSRSGKALGQDVANYLRANAGTLGVRYVIWNQHIWNVERSKEGWRYMADRGGASANHQNHVHVTVYG